MGNGCVRVHKLEQYHQEKLKRIKAVPRYWCPTLATWCVAWDKLQNDLILLEREDKLIQRFGKDGPRAHLRKPLSHYGAVRWEVLAPFSKWPLKQYLRWRSAAGDWYVDCGNWNYCNILNDQCGILYCYNNQHIRHAVEMGKGKVGDIVEAILGATVLVTRVDESEALLKDVESMGLSLTAWNKWRDCLEGLCKISVYMQAKEESLGVPTYQILA